MRLNLPTIGTFATAVLALDTDSRANGSLVVYDTPQTIRPYILPKGYGLGDGGNIYAVTGNSSGKAFCLMISYGAGNGALARAGVFPHVHMKTYENFYATKGRVQLWGMNYNDYKAKKTTQQTRVLTQGDIGTIPNNTIHTFQLIDPDTTLTGVLVPGGFEELFFAMARNFSMVMDEEAMNGYDVYPLPAFVPRTDVVNQKGGTGNWHDGANNLTGSPNQPGWIAKNYGPKYLNSAYGYYQIIATLVTGAESENRFTQGTITVSQKPANQTLQTLTVAGSFAFQMEEGMLSVSVNGEAVDIIQGDVFFVPANTPFSYYAKAQFTKFMYVSQGVAGIDALLLKSAIPWTSAFYPVAAPASTTKPAMTKREEEFARNLAVGMKF